MGEGLGGWGDIALSLMPDTKAVFDPSLFEPVLSATAPTEFGSVTPAAPSSSEFFSGEGQQAPSRGFGDVAKAALPWIKEGIGLTGAAGNLYGIKQLADQTSIAKSAEKRQA